MRSFLNVAPEDQSTSGGGGGPEDDPRFARTALRTQGFLTLAFGFALGIALMLLYGMILIFKPSGPIADFFNTSNPSVVANLGLSFLIGFVGGTLISGIYNLLVVNRLNLFGLESSLD